MAPKVMKKAKTVMKSAPKSKKPKKKANKLPNITDTNGGGSFPWVLVGSGESWWVLVGSRGFWCVVLVSSGSAAGNIFKERLLERYLSKGMRQSWECVCWTYTLKVLYMYLR